MHFRHWRVDGYASGYAERIRHGDYIQLCEPLRCRPYRELGEQPGIQVIQTMVWKDARQLWLNDLLKVHLTTG